MATIPVLTYFIFHLYLFKGILLDFDSDNRPIASGVMSLLSVQIIIYWFIYSSIQESKEEDEQDDFYNLKKK